MNKEFPKFVIFNGNGSTMRIVGVPNKFNEVTYYRDAGDWEVKASFLNNKLIIIECLGNTNLHGIELLPIEKQQYINDNMGYV